MLVYHYTKNDFKPWAYIPVDTFNVPRLLTGDAWNFMFPYDCSKPYLVGPAEWEVCEKEESSFTMTQFYLRQPQHGGLGDPNWSIVLNKAAKALLDHPKVASFPYARSLPYE